MFFGSQGIGAAGDMCGPASVHDLEFEGRADAEAEAAELLAGSKPHYVMEGQLLPDRSDSPLGDDTAMLQAELLQDPSCATLVMVDADVKQPSWASADLAGDGAGDPLLSPRARPEAGHKQHCDVDMISSNIDSHQDASSRNVASSAARRSLHDEPQSPQQRFQHGMDQNPAPAPSSSAGQAAPPARCDHRVPAIMDGHAEQPEGASACSGQPCPPRIHPACGQQPGIRSPAQLRSNLPALGSPARENAGAQGSGQPEGDVQQQDPSRESGEDGDGCQEGAAVPCARPAQRRVPELHRRRRAQLDQMPQWLVAGGIQMDFAMLRSEGIIPVWDGCLASQTWSLSHLLLAGCGDGHVCLAECP